MIGSSLTNLAVLRHTERSPFKKSLVIEDRSRLMSGTDTTMALSSLGRTPRLSSGSKFDIKDYNRTETKLSFGPKPVEPHSIEYSPNCKPTQFEDYNGLDEIENPTKLTSYANPTSPRRYPGNTSNRCKIKAHHYLEPKTPRNVSRPAYNGINLPSTNEELHDQYIKHLILKEMSPKPNSRHGQISTSNRQ